MKTPDRYSEEPHLIPTFLTRYRHVHTIRLLTVAHLQIIPYGRLFSWGANFHCFVVDSAVMKFVPMKSNASTVICVTSIVCILSIVHALRSYQKPFIIMDIPEFMCSQSHDTAAGVKFHPRVDQRQKTSRPARAEVPNVVSTSDRTMHIP